MRNNRWLVIGVLLMGVTVGALTGFAEDEKVSNSETVSFEGKIVWAMIASSKVMEDGRDTEILKNPVLRKIGGRFFLVGVPQRRSESTFDWRASSEAGVAWDSVQQYYVYTPEEFAKVMENYPDDDSE